MEARTQMNFEKFFRSVSYAAVFCGFLSLCISGTFGIVSTGLFVAVMISAWQLEGSRWQISERLGTVLIVLALPLFFVAWKMHFLSLAGGETAIAGILSRMILSLAAVKLLQKKSDRDWIFLYLMSFFEVLLAAGLSISALYFASFIFYLLVMTCAMIAFEIRKTARAVENKIADFEPDRRTLISEAPPTVPIRRLPSTALALITFIVLLAVPLFFMLPRVGGAGLGGSDSGRRTSGFSDRVTLGSFGRIRENDEVVMRVKFEGGPAPNRGLYFRGIALDTFDNQTWSKSRASNQSFTKTDNDLIRFDYASSRQDLSVQTIYLEPLDAQILFGLPRIVGVQGNFPMLYRDSFGAISYTRNFERISYKVVSDRSIPSESQLRSDDQPYAREVQNYRDLPPNLDPRIADLATDISSASRNRYDEARAIENYLQTSYGYTLDLKASGDQPVADFLFNVREGHCEYFATAMAVMLRTQGIASRVVTGFHGGEYNDAADVTVVRQRNAHAWVEVYFPENDAWITFDPTPVGGQGAAAGSDAAGISGTVSKYIEAIETFWIQYFVAFDNQEQRGMARSIRDRFVDYQAGIASYFGQTQDLAAEWLSRIRGEKGFDASRDAILRGVAWLAGGLLVVAILAVSWRRLRRSRLWQRVCDRLSRREPPTIVEFYARMERLLAAQGIRRESQQTPLEFATATGVPQAVRLAQKYNSVRFGLNRLTADEAIEIESSLAEIAAGE
ncbi:MAG: DUF3488 and transglutaminase-like domain-containing protein [Pyrinomonadaceae bacterium]